MTSVVKASLSRVIPAALWSYVRERRIVHSHARTAELCSNLVKSYETSSMSHQPLPLKALKEMPDDKVIWQYWAQGYDEVPSVVKECLDSVDRWRGEYRVIRLHDGNISDYIELPDYIQTVRGNVSKAYFSDLLRVCLLSVYGGLWLDATVLLSAPIPDYISAEDFFLYQRDPEEKNRKYWENVYAYYFGWAKGFRVNMLSSVFYSKKGGRLVSTLCGVMLYYWSQGNTTIPDYFFLQILFDVLVNPPFDFVNCRIISDCKPHYLQQIINDPSFSIAAREEVLSTIPIHKLTYK